MSACLLHDIVMGKHVKSQLKEIQCVRNILVFNIVLQMCSKNLSICRANQINFVQIRFYEKKKKKTLFYGIFHNVNMEKMHCDRIHR